MVNAEISMTWSFSSECREAGGEAWVGGGVDVGLPNREAKGLERREGLPVRVEEVLRFWSRDGRGGFVGLAVRGGKGREEV
jgi:hypothetical protein